MSKCKIFILNISLDISFKYEFYNSNSFTKALIAHMKVDSCINKFLKATLNSL